MDEEQDELSSLDQYFQDLTAVEGESPLSALARDPREKLLIQQAEAAEARRKKMFDEQLSAIEAAKKRLLQQPTPQSKAQMLAGMVQKFREGRSDPNDPRFYEKRNLMSVLRDVGAYRRGRLEDEKKAAQAKEEQMLKLDDLRRRYMFEEAGREAEAARGALEKYRPAGTLTGSSSEFERLIANLPPEEQERLRKQRAYSLATDGRVGAAKEEPLSASSKDIRWARSTLANPMASAIDKQTAQDILVKSQPQDVRKANIAKDKNSISFLSRLKDQSTFTLPDIQSAIDQVDQGGIFAAGNIAKIIRGKPVIGQAATDLEKTIESIKSKVGFDKLQTLRDTSPTGASGLGAVSNIEQRLLQSVKGSLDEDQSPANLRRNLVRLKDFYEREAFEILERETGITGLSGIESAIQDISSASQAPAAVGGELTPAQKAAQELARRRARAQGGG